MKSHFKLTATAFVLFALLFSSCKKEDPSVTAEDQTFTLEENPTQGQVIGEIQASFDNVNNKGFSFSPEHEGLAEHVTINRTSGYLTVSNPAYFDYEQVTSASAQVKISGFNDKDVEETTTITINITDVEDGGGIEPPPPPTKTVQQRLNEGETPLAIFTDDNSFLDSLYGKTYEGGLIAYLNTSTGAGFVVAPSDLSTTYKWDHNPPAGGFTQTNDTLSAIGSGAANTSGIVDSLGAGANAASACTDLSQGGKTDWYLPSTDELTEAWRNLHNRGSWKLYLRLLLDIY